MVFPGLLALHELLESAQRPERVDDDLPRIRIGAQEELALGDVSGVVRDGMSDVAVVECCHCNDGDGTAVRQLYSLLVNLREVGVERTRH